MVQNERMNIGDRIRALREGRDLTLEQVGAYLGVSRATVQRYESGDIDIKRRVAIKLAEILHTTPSYIMGWVDTPHTPNKLVIPEILNDVQVAFSGGAANGLTQDDIDMLVEMAEKMKRANDNTGPANRA